MDFWYSDKEYKEYLNQRGWGIVNDEANYKDGLIPLFLIECLYDVKYEVLLKFYGDKETTHRIWEEINFCKLMRELRPPKYKDEYLVQKTKRAKLFFVNTANIHYIMNIFYFFKQINLRFLYFLCFI